MRTRVLLFAALLLTGCRTVIPGATLPPKPVIFVERAHSHNDYTRARPLQAALENGFGSVEADIHLIGSGLWIGHLFAINPGLNLESLYLKPLRERIKANGGWVYAPGQTLTLLVDVKLDAADTYAVLHRVLSEYADILTRVENGAVIPGAVKVVITGNRDRELLRAQNVRYAFFEGTLNDLNGTEPTSLIPAVSDSWKGAGFHWNGQGEIPAAERTKLRELAQKAAAQGRTLRLWDAPDTPAAWNELLAAGVTLINTDHLPQLREFLLKNDPQVQR